MRWVLVPLVLFVGCKKMEDPAPQSLGPEGPPPSGHSVTQVKENTGSAKVAHDTGSGSAEAAPTADAAMFGGNGKPAYRDASGHVHGPGGPIFMGHGPECNETTDHCLRDGVWFAVGDLRPGSLYRATPAFEFESKWWDFRESEVSCGKLLKTKVATASDIQPGSPIIWLVEENQQFKWLDNEMDALTSSRWEAGIIDEAPSGGKFKVKGWDWTIRVETARAITDQKDCPNAS